MPNIPNSSSPPDVPPAGKAKKLLDQYSEFLRNRHYSLRTEKTYIGWVRQYILYHNKRHPREMGVGEINDFITHLVNQKTVSASTQNQAISAILYLYRNILNVQLDEKALVPIRPTKPKRIPTVLSKDEARRVISKMDGIYKIMTQIMYGSGLRLMEVMRLRVKDLDFANRHIIVRDGKGENDRVTMFPDVLLEPLRLHLKQVRAQHELDLSLGYGTVYLPYALERKYPRTPAANLPGNMSFRRAIFPSTPSAGSDNATTSAKQAFKGPSNKPPISPESTNVFRRVRFDIVSPLIC